MRNVYNNIFAVPRPKPDTQVPLTSVVFDLFDHVNRMTTGRMASRQ